MNLFFRCIGSLVLFLRPVGIPGLLSIETSSQVHVKKISILLVEDEPIIAADLEDRLEEMGYEVAQHCFSGEEALEYFYQSDVDLVLMDVHLSGKFDGIQTAEKLMEKRPVPLIYLTGNSDQLTFARARNTSPAAFLTKPFRGKDLMHAIELAISRGQEPSPVNAKETQDTYLFKDRIFIKIKDRLQRFYFHEIYWLEADDYYCKLITAEKEFLVTQTLKQMSEFLAGIPAFMRIHRSFIVNVAHIEEIGDQFVTIRKKQIPLNKAAKEELTAQLHKL